VEFKLAPLRLSLLTGRGIFPVNTLLARMRKINPARIRMRVLAFIF